MARFVLQPDERILQRVPAAAPHDNGTVKGELIVTDLRIVLATERHPRRLLGGLLWIWGLIGIILHIGRILGRIANGAHVSHVIARDDVAFIELDGEDLRVSSGGEGYDKIWFDVRLAQPAAWANYLIAWRSRAELPRDVPALNAT